MSDMLSIGASGLRSYQTALNTTSENIANAATPGYSRRSTTIADVGRTVSVQLGQTTKLGGSGSIVTGFARASDAFRVAEARTTGADLARTESGVVWLERLEGALTGNKLSERLTSFFNAAKGVAADPAASAPRVVMLESASNLAAALSGTGRALADAQADLGGMGTASAKQLSDLAASLVRTNQGLVRAQPNSVAQAQLLDERDRLLESMSALVDISVQYDEFGRAAVRAGGPSGPLLADGESASFVSFAMNSSGATSFAVHRGSAIEAMPANGGSIAGISDGATRLAAALDSLNDLATRFVDGMNALQQGGRDLDGAAGADMFAVGSSPTDIRMVLSDPRGIAAAAVGEGSRGNGNLTAMAEWRTTEKFEAALDDIVTTNAAALSTRRGVAEAQGAIHAAAVAARDAVSGVDLDEEAVNLIRFQQAYQASSRVIQVARDTLQTILDI